MEFGKVDPSEIDKIDFRLPEDGPFTQKVLPGKPAAKLKVYIGCAKWGRKDWIGKLYPPKTKESEFLEHYVKHFNTIELNATHYQIYPASTIKKWGDKAKGLDFTFCPKVPQTISHYTDLASDKAQALTDQFLQGVEAFGKQLGPIFLQVSEKYSPQKKDALLKYVEKLPKDARFCVEVRHPSWFSDGAARKELFGTLAKQKAGTVITDTSGRRDCAHMELTTPVAFIRFVGNNLHPTDYTRVDDWVQRMKSWIAKGIKEIYFFMHQHEEIDSPKLCDYVIQQMNKECGLKLQRPGLIDDQQGTLGF
jgi:uncharacterized protein YecE (DUF72 family)